MAWALAAWPAAGAGAAVQTAHWGLAGGGRRADCRTLSRLRAPGEGRRHQADGRQGEAVRVREAGGRNPAGAWKRQAVAAAPPRHFAIREAVTRDSQQVATHRMSGQDERRKREGRKKSTGLKGVLNFFWPKFRVVLGLPGLPIGPATVIC